MAELPSGTITFLFTDIEGSSHLWEQHPLAMRAALARHDALLREVVEAWGGHIFKTVGDAVCAVFAAAHAAVLAAVAAQRALATTDWGVVGSLKVRMALYTGTAELREGDYFGIVLNRLSRLLYAGYGGQVLVSATTQQLIGPYLPSDIHLRDLGERNLKDLASAERLYQLLIPGLPDEFPPLRTLEARPNNLPTALSSLIGREADLQTISSLVTRPGVRLLTLTGPGGSGKTRLALQLAADLLNDQEDGVFFVALATAHDGSSLVSTIAQAVGVKEGAEGDLLASLKLHLRDREMILVLDNFEQIVAAAPLLSELLAADRRLKMIVTSRAALQIYGENEYAVPPLALPKGDLPLAELAHYPAITLFVARACNVRANFQLTTENAAAVVEICQRLDGLPLAIELAAARSKMFGPAALLARLDNRLALLTSQSRDLPARQRSLRGAIDWSYDLLAEEERTLFAHLSIFVGGCTAAMAAEVCGEAASFEGIESLLNQSLLRQMGAEDEPRFTMLETLREYGREKLAERGEVVGLARQHALAYLRLAEAAEPELRGAEQASWLTRLEAEHDNLRAAFAYLSEQGEHELSLKMAASLWRFWYLRGYISEGNHWLHSALLGNDTPTLVRAQALNGLGVMAFEQGNFAEAKTQFSASLAIRQQLDDQRGVALSLNNLGSVAVYERDYEQAISYYEESLSLRRGLDDQWGVASSLTNLGIVQATHRNYERAMALLSEGLTICREIHDDFGTAYALLNIAKIAVCCGNYGEAHTALYEGIGIFQKLDDSGSLILCIKAFANLAIRQGKVERAVRLLAAALALRLSHDVPLVEDEDDVLITEQATLNARVQAGEFATAWAAGEQMSLEQAVEYVQDEQAEGEPAPS